MNYTMKNALGFAVTLAFTALVSSTTASAVTVFDDGAAADSLISNGDNWDMGLPTGGQQGTIAINAQYDSTVTHDGYDILHTDGNVSRGNSVNEFRLGTNTTWVMNGATAAITQTRGINLQAGSTFTLEQGNADLSDNNRDTAVAGAGAALTVNGGMMTIGRNLIVRNGAALTINGGTVTGIDRFFTQGFASAANGFFFNGGSTMGDSFQLDNGGGGTATFGGSTAGSLSLLTGLGNGVTLDWLEGSLMELTVNGANQLFYEDLYTNGDLLFAGSNAEPFADNFEVSGATLSLVQPQVDDDLAIVPEPASLTLVSIAGLLILRRSRRRH